MGSKVIDKVQEIRATTSILGLIQTALAEGADAVNISELSDALFEIYNRQSEMLAELQEIAKEYKLKETA